MAEPHVLFLCWGNICRSPMAEAVARAVATEQGVEARFSSAGVSDEELGRPMDRRATLVLREAGYRPLPHIARQVDAGLLARVDLVVGAEQSHLDALTRYGVDVETALVSDYDVRAQPGAPLPDPWYGGRQDFEDTLAVLQRAMPVLVGTLS